jgi:hypothetical protein
LLSITAGSGSGCKATLAKPNKTKQERKMADWDNTNSDPDTEGSSSLQPHIDVVSKVSTIFKELVGERAANLHPTIFPYAVRDVIKRALTIELDEATASRLGLHLVDWNGDAAFLVALLLFPERFSPAEIRAGVEALLIHVPDHVAAAAKLGGVTIRDTFGLGIFEPQEKH